MKILTFLCLFLVLSCGVKQTRYAINSGDYNEAIQIATNNLRNNKDKKGKQEYIYMLEEAFEKAKERDLEEISFLTKSNTPRNFEKLYNLYVALDQRQQEIRPLLPLHLLKENRNAKFKFEDYSDKLIKSRADFVNYLYENSAALLLTNDKLSYRRAYEDLSYLRRLNPDYKNTNQLIEQAFAKGADFVKIETRNNTGMVIPMRLQNDLLNFSTQGIDEKWVVYHSVKQQGVKYDYGIFIDFRQINISPDLLREKETTVEKEIIEKRKKLDRRGQVIKDSLGNIVMEEVVKKISAKLLETTQSKTVEITAKIEYINLNSSQLLQSFPLQSQFVFENIFAKFNGDINAIEKDYQQLLKNRPMPFPSNEQMIYDTGEDLKAKVKAIITTNRIIRQ